MVKRKDYISVVSPDENIECRVFLKSKKLYYFVLYKEKIILDASKLGFLIFGENPLDSFQIIDTSTKDHQENIEMLWGDTKYIENNYNELIIKLAPTNFKEAQIKVIFRVFNDSVAFRYGIGKLDSKKHFSLKDELTEFNVDSNARLWTIPAYQPDRYEYNYEEKRTEEINNSVHTPLTINLGKTFISIHEAGLYDYGAMTIKNSKDGVLKADITPMSDKSIAHICLPFKTPWRLIMIADSAIELTRNRTMYALNAPPKGDFSWVKTLQFIGIWWAMYVGEWTWAPGENHGATTEHVIEYIDQAVKLGISGLLIEGWNDGWEGDWLENGANTDFTKPMPDFDLEKVARYAKAKKIELIGHHETVGYVDNYEKQLKKAYDYYILNGIHYIKTGYAGSMMMINGRKEFHHSQLGVKHYQKALELASKKRICLNVHEPIKGTGIERTWPNLLTREGARGQEYEGGALEPSHACILPYTRLLSGGMDYTSGIFDLKNPKKRIFTTLARQIAYYIVIYSGMQMLADQPKNYEHDLKAEFEFIKNIPTDFEKQVPIAGQIGEYYIVARKDRNSKNWFVGGVTNETGRRVNIELNFLENATYEATVIADSGDAHYKDNPFGILKYSKKVTNLDSIEIYIAPGGGFAIKLEKI